MHYTMTMTLLGVALGRRAELAGVQRTISWQGPSIDPFACTDEFLDRPLQVLVDDGAGSDELELRYMDLGGGTYTNIFNFTDLTATFENGNPTSGPPSRVNAAAMYFDADTEENYPFASFNFENSGQPRLCRFDDQRIVCFAQRMQTRSFAGAIVGTTYYHAAGIARNPMYVVRDINSVPSFPSTEYNVILGDGTSQLNDITSVAKDFAACGPTGCVISSPDDAVVAQSTHFLIGLANNLAAVLVVAIDANEDPTHYMWVSGLNIITEQGDLLSTGEPLSDYGAGGACFTLYSPSGTAIRVLCSSNLGNGHFELSLPLDISYCEQLCIALCHYSRRQPSLEHFWRQPRRPRYGLRPSRILRVPQLRQATRRLDRRIRSDECVSRTSRSLILSAQAKTMASTATSALLLTSSTTLPSRQSRISSSGARFHMNRRESRRRSLRPRRQSRASRLPRHRSRLFRHQHRH